MTYNRTKRRHFTPTQRLAFFEAHHGICYLCRGKINGAVEAWEIEHIIAREIMGDGADDDDNLALAHKKCHAAKTAQDRKAIAKSNAVQAKHFGARKPSRLQSAGFAKAPPQRTASTPPTKTVRQFARAHGDTK